jgi:hypothetical protein
MKYYFKKHIKHISKKMLKKLFKYFQIKIKPSSTLYICSNCLHNINENKSPSYQVPNISLKNKNNFINII